MTTQIRIRRGTKTQLATLMAGATPLASGELGFTTDTKEVFVSDGSATHLIGRVLVGLLTARPAAGQSGSMYHATDDSSTWVDNGTSWVDVSGGLSTLDDLADGTTYGKVLNTYLDSNRPDGLWDGAVKLTGSVLRTHLNTIAQHREINDAGGSSTDLWSADKITTAIDNALTGLDFQADVIAIQGDASLDPTGSPVVGARYIINNSSSLHANFGTITGVADGDIVEYNGSIFIVSYDVSVSGEGALVWDRDTDTYQKWDGTTWAEFGGLSGITAGSGLTKAGNTLNVGQGNGINVLADAITVKPDVTTGATVAPVAVTSAGVGVILDNDSLAHVGGAVEVKKVDGGTFV